MAAWAGAWLRGARGGDRVRGRVRRAARRAHARSDGEAIGSRSFASPLAYELKIGGRPDRPCARDASICRILQDDGDEVSNTQRTQIDESLTLHHYFSRVVSTHFFKLGAYRSV